MRRILLSPAALVLVPLAVLVVGAGPAAADCAGPTISYATGPVARGATLLVEGERWGDSCHDTGEPPPGQGVLGLPVTDIEVLLVQGDRTWVVAEGDADADLAFAVEVTVPPDATPGPATIRARAGGLDVHVDDATAADVTITDAPASGSPTAGPAPFGPSSTTVPPPAPSTSAPPDGPADGAGDPAPDRSAPALRIAGGAMAAVAAAVAVWISRRGGGR